MCSFNVHEQTSTNSHEKRLRRGNQINWQYWAQKTEDEDKQSKKHNKICVGHQYMQTSINNI
jgi:hypothetical protein